ncbi:hypothetical protein LguiB_022573 [Lonicera macranthoides]
MAYDTMLARSFSRHDQRKLGCGALVGSLIIALCFCTVFKHYVGPLPVMNLRSSMGVGLKLLMATEDKINSYKLPTKIEEEEAAAKIICNFSEPRSDFCNISGDIRIRGNSSTIFAASSLTHVLAANNSWFIRPYARKMDTTAMGHVKNFTIKTSKAHSPEMPLCTKNHSVTAIVFSIGGFTGNQFHDFSDVLIPLYLTSRQFNGEVQFIVVDRDDSWWIKKFRAFMENLSNYAVIHLDEKEGVHCFKRMIVGLRGHKEFGIDPSKSPYSMKDFREFLRRSYSLKRERAINLRQNEGKKPRILIISRMKTRVFLNDGEIADVARKLGYEVVVMEATPVMSQMSQVVNSCDVVMGVHGAGLTNMVFMPENGVLIQVVPLGGMEWIANTDFGEPSKDMNLRYLEYKISEAESSLGQQYPPDHEVFRNPIAIS